MSFWTYTIAVVWLTGCGSVWGAGGAGVVLTRDAAIGAKYQTPGPRTCSAPAGTGDDLSSADARAYVICGQEGVFGSGQLALVSDVTVQVAPGRPYEALTDAFGGIDPARPVHDIRGSMNTYSCQIPGSSVLGSPRYAGQTCRGGSSPHAKGLCFHDTFGDWHCTFLDISHDTVQDLGMPPPASD